MGREGWVRGQKIVYVWPSTRQTGNLAQWWPPPCPLWGCHEGAHPQPSLHRHPDLCYRQRLGAARVTPGATNLDPFLGRRQSVSPGSSLWSMIQWPSGLTYKHRFKDKISKNSDTAPEVIKAQVSGPLDAMSCVPALVPHGCSQLWFLVTWYVSFFPLYWLIPTSRDLLSYLLLKKRKKNSSLNIIFTVSYSLISLLLFWPHILKELTTHALSVSSASTHC